MVLDVPATPHSSFSEPPLRLIALCATLTNAREKSCGIWRKKFPIWNTPFTNSYGIFKISVLRSMLLSEHIPTPICHHLFYDNANRTATDSSSPFVVETTEEDKTPQANGTPILADTSKGIKKIEVYGYATSVPTVRAATTGTTAPFMPPQQPPSPSRF